MTIEHIYLKIEKYLAENFSEELTLDNSISYNDSEADVWGFNKIVILVKKVDDKIYYKPFFNTTSKK